MDKKEFCNKKPVEILSMGVKNLNVLITLQKGDTRKKYFPESTITALKKYGNVFFNESDNRYTEEQLAKAIKDIDICITHWGCPEFSEKVLKNADKLKLIAHAAGSVGSLVSEGVYKRGIKVCTANTLMAKHIAEGVFALIFSALRKIPQIDKDMKNKLWKQTDMISLYNQKIGLVGLGTIGRFLIDLLKPFDTEIKVYDPYISSESLDNYPNVQLASLEEVLSWGNIISIHAARTPETHNMINADRLKLIKNNAIFVNTSRGALVDEEALINELETKRFFAALDVYVEEPLSPDSRLRDLDNTILLPHCVGATIKDEMTWEMINEIERMIMNKPLLFEVSFERSKLMTR